jgi:hypothetical protein
MKPAGLSVWKASRRLLCGQRGGEIVAFEAAVHAAARQLGVEAAPHRLDDVIKRQRQAVAQFEDQGLFPIADRRRHAMRAGRTVDDIGAGFPARHGAGMDAELLRQRGSGGGALLDISAGARGGGGIGVQSELHQPALPVLGAMASPGRRAPWVFKGYENLR